MASNMTDDDKVLVERLFAMADEYDSGHHESWPTIDALEIAAHRIEALITENERLREALGLADAALRGANMNMNVVERKVRAALGETE